MDNAIEKIGLALGQKDTEKILALYAGIAAGDLASGTELAGGCAVLNWSGLLKLHHAVTGENWRPNILAFNEMQLHQLLNDNKFVQCTVFVFRSDGFGSVSRHKRFRHEGSSKHSDSEWHGCR